MPIKNSKELRKELDEILEIFQPGVGFGGGSDALEHERIKADLKMKELGIALQTENKQMLDWIAIGGLMFAVVQTAFTVWDHIK